MNPVAKRRMVGTLARCRYLRCCALKGPWTPLFAMYTHQAVHIGAAIKAGLARKQHSD